MFDLFGFGLDTEKYINDVKNTSIHLDAIWSVLLDKKIITDKEYTQYMNKAKQEVEAIFENAVQEKREEMKKEYGFLEKFL